MAQGPRDLIHPGVYFSNSLRFMENSVLSFLQSLFSTMPGVGSTPDGWPNAVPAYRYTPDDGTEIRIEGQSTDNLTTVDNRPKITVARGTVSYQKAGINNFVGSANLSKFRQQHTAILSGSIGISCYSREELEADGLAQIVADSLEFFSPVIRTYGYLEFHTSQIGSRAMIGADSRPELFVVPVLVRVGITKNWKREVVDPVELKKMILKFVDQHGALIHQTEG